MTTTVRMATWIAMVSGRDRPQVGARGAQKNLQEGPRECLHGGLGEMGLLGAHWPFTASAI